MGGEQGKEGLVLRRGGIFFRCYRNCKKCFHLVLFFFYLNVSICFLYNYYYWKGCAIKIWELVLFVDVIFQIVAIVPINVWYVRVFLVIVIRRIIRRIIVLEILIIKRIIVKKDQNLQHNHNIINSGSLSMILLYRSFRCCFWSVKMIVNMRKTL